MKKIDVRIKKTYAQLYNGFISLLKEKSFDDITVSQICDRSGVHRATFYKHFDDKYEFLSFCIESLLSDIDMSVLETDLSPENIKKSCTVFVKMIFEYINKYKYIFTAVFSSNQSIVFNHQLEKMVTSFCLEKFSSVLKGIPEYKLELLSNFYSGAVLEALKWYVTQESECSLEDIYVFFEHRIDEISLYYRNHYMDRDV